MARLSAPDRVFRWSGDILRGDANRQWGEWLLATFCDVEGYAASKRSYPEIFEEVKANIAATWQEMEPHDQRELATRVSRIAAAEARRRSDVSGRSKLTIDQRQQLIDAYDGPPYCWICGLRFSEAAIATFLGRQAPPLLPKLIDVFKPIGLSARHLRIEVDHVTAHSRGGGDAMQNLELACGWCNIHKSDRLSIYEVGGEARPAGGDGATRQLPQPFWTVRLMALEGASGRISPHNGELSVCLRNPRGAPSPANLMVVQYGAGDPLGSARFQSREHVARMWGASERR